MTDPQRLFEGTAEATREERELLRAARGVRLSEDERRAIWSSVTAELALPVHPAPTENAAPSGASAGSAIGLGKVIAATAVVVTLGAGGYALLRPTPKAQNPPAARALASAQSATAAARAEPEHSAPPAQSMPAASTPLSALRPPRSAASSTVTPSTRASLLREESLGILAVRSALRGGDFALALQRLEQAKARFPHGALGQEREALAIEALAKSGARKAAEQRARAFLRTYPKSPYGADVERYANP